MKNLISFVWIKLQWYAIIYVPVIALSVFNTAAVEEMIKAAGFKIKYPDSKPLPYNAQSAASAI